AYEGEPTRMAKVTRLKREVVDPLGLAPTADGSLLALSHRESVVHRFPAGGGPRTEKPFASPTGGAKYGWRDLAVGKDGAAYVTDELSNAVLVRKPGADAAFVPFATGLSSPSGLVFGPDGALYVTEEGTGRLSRLSADGKTVTVLAEGMGRARDASFLDARTLLVTDREGGAVWKVTLPAAP
ncbi:MAG TPA: hypothetical protein VM490_13315, partial [Armatimonadaceae bacterium]|nr:hypothetical protein [Armatimonadaceae bacterium]